MTTHATCSAWSNDWQVYSALKSRRMCGRQAVACWWYACEPTAAASRCSASSARLGFNPPARKQRLMKISLSETEMLEYRVKPAET